MSVSRLGVNAERERGRVGRSTVPRRVHATLAARPIDDDPVGRLMEQSSHRLVDLTPLRFSRMVASPFAFLRGADLLMAGDLKASPSTELIVQLCGDAHIKNFGLFASPELRLVFDVNDFDETAPGPFEWDLKRLCASLSIAADLGGLDEARRLRIVRGCVGVYRSSMRRFSTMNRLDVWYATLEVANVFSDLGDFFTDAAKRNVEDLIGSVRTQSTRSKFDDLIERTSDGPRIRLNPPRMVPLRDLGPTADESRATVDAVLEGYRDSLVSDRRFLLDQFRVVDVARLVVGVGSVGTEGYAVLLTGRDDDDPFFLQIKEARGSVLASPENSSSNPGDRVVRGQRLMQATPDAFLGWYSASGNRGFYVRQLYDRKASVDVERLGAKQLMTYGRVCAWVLARAHARSGTAAAIAGYLGGGDSFIEAVGQFAEAYRAQNLADYRALCAAVDDGRVPVAS
ncbi:MAG: DUF2252 domain-containing protein [Acidimicrobiales bacterium]